MRTNPMLLIPPVVLAALALDSAAGCSLGSAPPAPPADGSSADAGPSDDAPNDDAPNDDVPNDDAPSGCAGELVALPGEALGALAATTDGFLYIAGAPNFGGSWQLAELDLTSRSLTPVIQLDNAYTYEHWIELNGDEVSVFEFYPSGDKHTFHRGTRQVSRSSPSVEPNANAYEHDGSLYYAHVGSGDACSNVCILRDDQSGAPPTELVDDGDEDFTIHTGAVYFLDDYVYFMTYQSAFDSPGNNALRRISLDTGELEVVFPFEGPRVNAWIYEPVRSPSGLVYWLRYEQETFESPWLYFIDRHDPATGSTEAGFIRDLGHDARSLELHDEQLLWVDSGGLRAARAVAGATPRTLAALPDDYESALLYFTVEGDRAFYARTVMAAGERDASVGCALLTSSSGAAE